MIEWLRQRWLWVVAVTVAAAVGISVFEPSYNAMQTAPSGLAFRQLPTGEARALAAATCDTVFALGYGALGLIALRALNVRPRLARPAAIVVIAAATFDIVENLVLMRNVIALRTVTDGWVTVMRVPGTLKWIGSPVFLVLLIALAVRTLRRTRSRHADAGVDR